MQVPSGRWIWLIIYATLAIQGFIGHGSGFLLILSLQIELLTFIFGYMFRPEKFQKWNDPDASIILIGSLPLLLFSYALAVGLGAALGEFPTDHPSGFLAVPTSTLSMPMLVLLAGHICARVLDRIHFKDDQDYWTYLTSRMVIHGSLIGSLGLVGLLLLYWFGEEQKAFVISGLVLVRFAIELHLRPLPGPPSK